MSGPHGFLASDAHLVLKNQGVLRNPKLRTEIEPKCSEDPCLGLHLNLGVKFRTNIKLLCLTKTSPPQNLLNQQKIDAYV